jgi:nitrite reductase/ring-hydroxylating ferredoxin subunit/uncharacterized membrane protein
MSAPEAIGRRRATPFGPFLDRVEAAAFLDPAAKAIAKRVRAAVSPRPLKEALSGTWLGHALHPALTDVVIGSFLSATLLDLLGADPGGRTQSRLIGVGLVAAVPTAATGANDWADSEMASDGVRRAGAVHASSNTLALVLFGSSLAARRRGASQPARLFAVAGTGVLVVSGYLGGHLSYGRGVGPDQTIFDPGPDDWTAAGDASQLQDGRPTRVVVDETPVLVLRTSDGILAIHDRCSHRGCSLSELGEVQGDHIVCGCHGSAFDLRDGSVQRGPASAPQPAFDVRESDGRMELRRMAT